MSKEDDSQPQEPINRRPGSVWIDVEYNRMQRMMHGVTWQEQYGDPIKALAQAKITNPDNLPENEPLSELGQMLLEAMEQDKLREQEEIQTQQSHI